MVIRRVAGASMVPALTPGTIVVAFRRRIRVGDIVIARQGSREVIKRVDRLADDHAYLVGDNRSESADSRHYGAVKKSAILGAVMIQLPSATEPPKAVKPYGLWLGRVAALILILMAVVHLFRIDTFIPILQTALQADTLTASVFALVIILSEIFAIPFALRIRLSPLGHLASGVLMLVAPFLWLFVSIWTLGISDDTGQLGQFLAVPGSLLVLVLNALWLGYNHVTLYSLGFNTLRLSSVLRK